MDGYDGAGYGVGGAEFNFDDPIWVSLRRNMGYTLNFASKMNLAEMTPHGELASTGYCLAAPAGSSAEFLVYLPDGGNTTVNLNNAVGAFSVEWFNPETGATTAGDVVNGGSELTLAAPLAAMQYSIFIQSTGPRLFHRQRPLSQQRRRPRH